MQYRRNEVRFKDLRARAPRPSGVRKGLAEPLSSSSSVEARSRGAGARLAFKRIWCGDYPLSECAFLYATILGDEGRKGGGVGRGLRGLGGKGCCSRVTCARVARRGAGG